MVASEFRFYPVVQEQEPAVQVEIVPEPPPVVPPPPERLIAARKPAPASPPPTPQLRPKAQSHPIRPTPKLVAQPAAKESGLVKLTPNAKPMPAPKLAPALSPLAPATSAHRPGPPKAVPASSLVKSQPQAANTPQSILLRKKRAEEAARLATGASLPSAFAPPAPPGGATASAAAPGAAPGGGPGGFPAGAFGRFGSGLRGSLIGCVDAAVVKLTTQEKARCAERFGAGALIAPRMDPIGATRRAAFEEEAAKEAATQKYLDSMPPPAGSHSIAGQPTALKQPVP